MKKKIPSLYLGRYYYPNSIFFFIDSPPTEIYTLSLHDALPISDQEPLVVVRGAEQLRRGRVVERLGQRMILTRQVTGDHRHPRWCLLPAPLIDPDEEHPQRAQIGRAHV